MSRKYLTFKTLLILLLVPGLFSLAVLAYPDPKVVAVENYIEALNNEDIEFIKALYADDATAEDPVGSEILEGHAAVIALYADGAFKSDLTAELTGPIRIAGNSAAFSFNLYVNGMKMEVIDVFEFNEDNKVTSLKAYWSFANLSPNL
jgi:steroid delta-isomerase